jgi:hypothetical protein
MGFRRLWTRGALAWARRLRGKRQGQSGPVISTPNELAVRRLEAFEHEGLFWLPADEENKVAGKLKFDPTDGATLSLLGAFGTLQQQFTSTPPILRIHGVAGRRHLTLNECFLTNTTLDMPGITRQTYHVGTIITHALFAPDEPLTFDEVSITLDQLPTWIRRTGVTINFTQRAGESTDEIDIDYRHPVDEAVTLDDCDLRLSSSWGLAGDNITTTQLSQGTYLTLSYRVPRELSIVLDDVKALQDLLTLATDAPAVAEEITLRRTDLTRDAGPGITRPEDMSFYAGQPALRVSRRGPQAPGRVLFQYQDIGGLPTVGRWLAIARTYDTTLGSLLSIRYASGLYTENRFHNVISAAETFHRLRFPNEVMPQQEFKEFRRMLIRSVPKEHRNWLGNQLQYSNEPRLRERIMEMADYVREAFTAVSGDPETWVRVVVESRNRLIHHEEDRAVEFKPGDLHFLAESIFLLVMLCLFRECGVDGEILMRASDSGSMQFLREKLVEVIPRLDEAIQRVNRQQG